MRCEFWFESLAGSDREAAASHLAECADCRALLAALQAPEDPGLADGILARTSGTACERARSRLCDRIDGLLSSFDTELVDQHLEHCSTCGALARELRTLADDLVLLASVDPGPGFVEAVLARTSRRPRRAPLRERWAAAVSRLLDRPRIALEGAFVAAVVAVLPMAGSPIAARPITALADARDTMSDIQATVHVEARSAWASTQAFAVLAGNRLREGTFARLGASRQRGGMSDTDDRNLDAAQEKRR